MNPRCKPTSRRAMPSIRSRIPRLQGDWSGARPETTIEDGLRLYTTWHRRGVEPGLQSSSAPRPEIIKMSPIIRECEARNLDYFILHPGSTTPISWMQSFFGTPSFQTQNTGWTSVSGSHGQQTGKMLAGIEDVLQKESPGCVVVLAIPTPPCRGTGSRKLHIPVCPWEPGGEVTTGECRGGSIVSSSTISRIASVRLQVTKKTS